MSQGFRHLVMTADQQENIFSPEDKEIMFAARPHTSQFNQNNWH